MNSDPQAQVDELWEILDGWHPSKPGPNSEARETVTLALGGAAREPPSTVTHLPNDALRGTLRAQSIEAQAVAAQNSAVRLQGSKDRLNVVRGRHAQRSS